MPIFNQTCNKKSHLKIFWTVIWSQQWINGAAAFHVNHEMCTSLHCFFTIMFQQTSWFSLFVFIWFSISPSAFCATSSHLSLLLLIFPLLLSDRRPLGADVSQRPLWGRGEDVLSVYFKSSPDPWCWQTQHVWQLFGNPTQLRTENSPPDP